MSAPDTFYRYEDSTYSGVRMVEFNLIKETPEGYWIMDGFDKRWVSKTGKKRYAYPTQAEALTSYIARKSRQKELLTAQLNNTRQRLEHACKLRDGAAKEVGYPMPRASSWDQWY